MGLCAEHPNLADIEGKCATCGREYVFFREPASCIWCEGRIERLPRPVSNCEHRVLGPKREQGEGV